RRGSAGEPGRRLRRRRPTGELRLHATREGEEVALLAARAQRLADELHDLSGRDAEGRQRARDAQRLRGRTLWAACPRNRQPARRGGVRQRRDGNDDTRGDAARELARHRPLRRRRRNSERSEEHPERSEESHSARAPAAPAVTATTLLRRPKPSSTIGAAG